MNETLELVCNEYFNQKKLIRIAEDEKKQAEEWEKNKPILIAYVGFCALILIFPTIYFGVRYIWAYLNSKRVGKVTRVPIIPWSQEGFKEFKGSQHLENVMPEARIQCRHVAKDWAMRDYALEKLSRSLKPLFNIQVNENDSEHTKFSKKHPIPFSARTISIKMENFKHGLKCHDFVPIYGTSPGSYYTYQMFGDNRIQVTNYVENGVSYVAGFCIYIDHPISWGCRFPEKVIKKCIRSRKYPRKDFNEFKPNGNVNLPEEKELAKKEESGKSAEIEIDEQEGQTWFFEAGTLPKANENSIDNDLQSSEEVPESDDQVSEPEDIPTDDFTVKHCRRLKRIVITKVESGKVFHQEWITIFNFMKTEECQMCTDLNKEEPPTYSSLSLV